MVVENPATWGKAERVIDEALDEADAAFQDQVCGLSVPRRIADALRQAGLLVETTSETPEPVDPVQAVHYWRRRLVDCQIELVEALKEINRLKTVEPEPSGGPTHRMLLIQAIDTLMEEEKGRQAQEPNG